MTRIFAVAAIAAALVAGSASTASATLPSPGGQCDGVVDVMCRGHVCQPEELDCGMIPPCLIWVAGVCLL